MKKFSIILFLCLSIYFFPQEITLQRFNEKPIIDGILNDPCWTYAPKVNNFIEYYPVEGRIPPVETIFYFGYDNENLYVGFSCEDNQNELKSTSTVRDNVNDFMDDYILFLLWTLDNPQANYIFGVNIKNIQMDMYSMDVSIDFDWKSAVKINPDRWEGELSIPLRNLRFSNNEIQKWKFIINRNRPRKDVFDYFYPPVSQDNPSDYDQAATLIINESLQPEYKKYEITPYVIGSQTGERVSSGSFNNDNGKFDIGIDRMNYILSPDNVLTFAVNPDFSTAELDQPQIDVNTTFALYYPEKRPFFFEGYDIFNAGFFDIFYSRTINEPSLIGKYTGKIGNLNLGYTTAYDEHTSWILPFEERSLNVASDKNSFVNIFRARYDIDENYFGFITTNRDLTNSYNRVIGFDAQYKIGKQNYIQASILRSWNKELDDTLLNVQNFNFNGHTSAFDGEDFSGNAYYLDFSHTSRHFGLNLNYKDISPDFRADNGFVSRNNLRQFNFSTGYTGYPNKPLLRNFTINNGFSWIWNYDGTLKYFEWKPWIILKFPYQTNLNLYYGGIIEKFGGLKFNKWYSSFEILSSPVKWLLFQGGYQLKRDINYFAPIPELGYSDQIIIAFLLSPVSNFNISFIYNYYQLFNDNRENLIYSGNVFSGSISYQPIRYFNIRILVQRDTFNDRIDVSPLISFVPSPFTAIYFGMNGNLEDEPKIRQMYRQTYLKLKYTF